jgi:hypothetical protein
MVALPSIEDARLNMLRLPETGLMPGKIWALDELAADCGQDKIYEFMLVAHPAVDCGCGRLTSRAAGDKMRASFDAKILWWEGCPWT